MKINTEIVQFANEFNINQLCNNFKYIDNMGSDKNECNSLLALGSKIFNYEPFHSHVIENKITKSMIEHYQAYNTGIKEILIKLVKTNRRRDFKGFNTKIENNPKRGTNIFGDKRKLKIDSIEEDDVKANRLSANLPQTDFVRNNKHLKNHSIKIVHESLNITEYDLIQNESYIKLERKKMVELFKIWNSLLKLNKKNNLYTDFSPKCEEEEKTEIIPNYVNFNILKVEDTFIQGIILNVLLMHLFSICHKELTYNIIKAILKEFHLSSKNINNINENSISFNLRRILETELEYLLGFYYELYDDYVVACSIKNIEKKEKLDFYNKYSDNFKKLEMGKLAIHISSLRNYHKEYQKFYLNDFHFDLRKAHINNYLIKNLEKELNILDTVVNLTQELYDYIIMRKFNKLLITNNTFHFKIFQEIRICFFEHIDKNSPEGQKIYSTLSARKLYEYKSKNLSNDFYFLSLSNQKQNNISPNQQISNLSSKHKYGLSENIQFLLNNHKKNLPIKLMNVNKAESIVAKLPFDKLITEFKLDIINADQTKPLKTEPLFTTELFKKHSESQTAIWRSTPKVNSPAFKNNPLLGDKEIDPSLILYKSALDKKNNKLKRNVTVYTQKMQSMNNLQSKMNSNILLLDKQSNEDEGSFKKKLKTTFMRGNKKFCSTSTSPMKLLLETEENAYEKTIDTDYELLHERVVIPKVNHTGNKQKRITIRNAGNCLDASKLNEIRNNSNSLEEDIKRETCKRTSQKKANLLIKNNHLFILSKKERNENLIRRHSKTQSHYLNLRTDPNNYYIFNSSKI
jgi:hypothetical protein